MQYDKFQKEAIEYINQGHSVIVSAPTGAGKTVIAEHIIRTSIDKTQGVIYTAPIKALSNQKFRDFKAQFRQDIGILTGDVSINPYARILIMTTEIFRNKTIEEPDSLKKYSWIIFDEVHYIDNFERGTVWEESLIFLPKHIKILCLSATIPNIEDFASWLRNLHNSPIKVIVEQKRPVPLHFFFQCQNEISDSLKKIKFPHQSSVNWRYGKRYQRQALGKKPNRLATLINHISQKNNLPLIYFVFNRRRTEHLACELENYNFLNSNEKREINSLFETLCVRFDLNNEPSALKLKPLIEKGIAYHHAGMLPTLKEAIEQLFASKLIKVIFTTETFALGINMPARSVAFDELKKFYGRFVRPLKTRDLFQMAGRAGRRGMDKEGFVYIRINPSRITLNQVKQSIYSKTEEIKSQLNSSYATILNLYDKYREHIFEIYPLSFHYYQSNKHSQKQAKDLIKAKIAILTDLKHINKRYDPAGGESPLTEKGHFAKAIYGYELILSELYEQGLLENLNETSLAILAAAIIFEPRKNQHIFSISHDARIIRRTTDKIFEHIKYKELQYKIKPLSKKPYFHLAASMHAWLEGENFSKILSLGDTDEGELVRYFRMALQILKEIRESPACSDKLHQRIKRIIQIINRDIIDAERQLRE